MSALEVSEEAIEKAAIRVAGMFAGDEGQWRGYWNFARAAVETAAPLIRAAELDERAGELDKQALALPRDGSAAPGMVVILQDIADDLRGRASVLRGEGDPNG